MSSIDVSLREIKDFVSSVSNLQSDMENAKREIDNGVSCINQNVDASIEETNKKIQEMIDDINLAGEVISHNQDVLNDLEMLKAKQEKAVQRAESAVNEASSALSRAKNSSCGSTEEEKRAHDKAVASAQSSLSKANDKLADAKRQLNQTIRQISHVCDCINKLKMIIDDINRYRNTALEYVRALVDRFNAVVNKQKEFEEVYTKTVKKVSHYKEIGDIAEKCISKAITHLQEASNMYMSDRICMVDTRAIQNLADLLKSIKRDAEVFAKKQTKSSAEYLNVMGDDISVATVGLCQESSAKCVRSTSNFDVIADKLLDAKRQLDTYTHLG